MILASLHISNVIEPKTQVNMQLWRNDDQRADAKKDL